MTNLTKLTAGALAGVTLLATAAPAEARWRDRDRGDRTALAIGAGALGLAVGAAIASSGRDRYYDRGYYGRGYYGRPYAYGYGYGHAPRYGYGRGYYDGWYGAPRARCWRERVWDDWRGRWRRVRVCR